MTANHVIASVLLWCGVAAELICLAGVVWLRDAFDGLHFVAAATTVGPVLFAVAAILTGFPSPAGTIGCVVACAALLLLNPMLTSATGRAGRDLVHEFADDGDAS